MNEKSQRTHRRLICTAAAAAGLALGCTADEPRPTPEQLTQEATAADTGDPVEVLPTLPPRPEPIPLPPPRPIPAALDIHRSLIVTDVRILESKFSFKKVMDQIVNTSPAQTTSVALFQQWWDTQREGMGNRPHCNDQRDGNGNPAHNGFPWACPRAEGAQATTDPFNPMTAKTDGYTPIALTNRFDLAPTDGSHCGEYRVIFGRNSGVNSPSGVFATDRNLVIFEAVLPNPHPRCGLEACRPVAEFWARLTSVTDVDHRAALLEQFFFRGIPGFRPVIHADHYGARLVGTGYSATGQIRSNQFMQVPWNLKEWRLVNDCRCGKCALVMVPTTVKTNPFGALFNETVAQSRGPAFRTAFLGQLASLAIPDINRFSHTVADTFNAGQSPSQGVENNYTAQLQPGPFQDTIAERLAAAGSNLTPVHIAARATAMSCGGCHQLSNNADVGLDKRWPASAGFVHVSEKADRKVMGPDGERWSISEALSGEFLPHRRNVLESFLRKRAPARPIPIPICRPRPGIDPLAPTDGVVIEPPEGLVVTPEVLPTRCNGAVPLEPAARGDVEKIEENTPPPATLGGRNTH